MSETGNSEIYMEDNIHSEVNVNENMDRGEMCIYSYFSPVYVFVRSVLSNI